KLMRDTWRKQYNIMLLTFQYQHVKKETIYLNLSNKMPGHFIRFMNCRELFLC
ncbi:unnamed protein product, partial [marine sediment metagenome]